MLGALLVIYSYTRLDFLKGYLVIIHNTSFTGRAREAEEKETFGLSGYLTRGKGVFQDICRALLQIRQSD